MGRERKGIPARQTTRMKPNQAFKQLRHMRTSRHLSCAIPLLLSPPVLSVACIRHLEAAQPAGWSTDDPKTKDYVGKILAYHSEFKISLYFLTSWEHPSTVSTCSTFTWGINSARLKSKHSLLPGTYIYIFSTLWKLRPLLPAICDTSWDSLHLRS